MRKLFYFLICLPLLLLSFFACNGNNSNNSNGNQQSEEQKTQTMAKLSSLGQEINPIVGTWMKVNNDAKIVYREDFVEEYYDRNWETGKLEFVIEREYVINEDAFRYTLGGKTYNYKLENDTMYVKIAPDYWEKYYRIEGD